MRCWWMTFMGKPRDHHVHDHAHESPLMYLPLIILAVGTFVSSYFLFRPMVAGSSPEGFLVATYDGVHATEGHKPHGIEVSSEAHHALKFAVGPAFLVGFIIAILIYKNGLMTAQRIAMRFKLFHTILLKKFYFDEIYGLILIGGTHMLKGLCYLFDRIIVDGIVNLSAKITTRLAMFTGNVLDALGVDGAVNGVGRGTWALGGAARSPQDGRIRNYILFVASGAAVVVLVLIWPRG
jgi:NADH-quinone oxidoreductase subunit L